MTARRSKPRFASLLRRASASDEGEGGVAPEAEGAFRVDPARVRLWSGLVGPTPEECRDRIGAIVREGQVDPVTVRPVFDDQHYEYEVISGARDYVAVRHLRDTAMPRLELLVRVELVGDDDVEELAGDPAPPAARLPETIAAAFGGEDLPADVVDELEDRIEGPMAPVILATARQIARAQDARRDDGLPPYPAAEVLRLIDAVGTETAPVAPLSLGIVDASASAVTFRLDATEEMPPEMLARVVKAMINGAAADDIPIRWNSED